MIEFTVKFVIIWKQRWINCDHKCYLDVNLDFLFYFILFFFLVLGFLILLFRYPHFYTCAVICAQSLMKLFLNFNFWNFHLSTCLKSYLMGSWIRKMQVLDQNEVYSYVLFGKFYFLLILNDSCNNVSKNL